MHSNYSKLVVIKIQGACLCRLTRSEILDSFRGRERFLQNTLQDSHSSSSPPIQVSSLSFQSKPSIRVYSKILFSKFPSLISKVPYPSLSSPLSAECSSPAELCGPEERLVKPSIEAPKTLGPRVLEEPFVARMRSSWTFLDALKQLFRLKSNFSNFSNFTKATLEQLPKAILQDAFIFGIKKRHSPGIRSFFRSSP